MLLFYVRHGDPIYDPDSLTPLGHRQAEAIARRLALYGIDRIYASTSNRAILTAQPTSELTKKEVTLLDFANEGHVWREFAPANEKGQKHWAFHDPGFTKLFMSPQVRELGHKWYDYPEFAKYEFKQGIERVDRETDAFLASLGYEHDREQGIYKAVKPSEERIALFAHQGFGLTFLSSVLDIPYPEFTVHFDMCHTGMTVIEFAETDGFVIPRVLTLSDDSHIYRDGLPTNYNNVLRF